MSDNNIFNHENGRYFKWTLLLILASLAAYVADTPIIKPNGGTWLGYTLGTIGAVLIVWLMLFGVRKRAYGSNIGTVRGWLSAHVYLGLSLIVVATLHTGFEFGWNVHTLAYTLMMLVIASGIWGTIIYFRNPSLMGRALHGMTLEEMAKSMRDLDKQSRNLLPQASEATARLVESSANVEVFSSGLQRFTGSNPACATALAVETMGRGTAASTAGPEQDIYLLQIKKQQLLKRLRHYIRLRTWVELWLLFHVPLSFALLATLTAHIVSVFFYW
jgi:hypothetical protein